MKKNEEFEYGDISKTFEYISEDRDEYIDAINDRIASLADEEGKYVYELNEVSASTLLDALVVYSSEMKKKLEKTLALETSTTEEIDTARMYYINALAHLTMYCQMFAEAQSNS